MLWLFLIGERNILWAGNTAASTHLILTVTFPDEVYLCPSSLHDHQSLKYCHSGIFVLRVFAEMLITYKQELEELSSIWLHFSVQYFHEAPWI